MANCTRLNKQLFTYHCAPRWQSRAFSAYKQRTAIRLRSVFRHFYTSKWPNKFFFFFNVFWVSCEKDIIQNNNSDPMGWREQLHSISLGFAHLATVRYYSPVCLLPAGRDFGNSRKVLYQTLLRSISYIPREIKCHNINWQSYKFAN